MREEERDMGWEGGKGDSEPKRTSDERERDNLKRERGGELEDKKDQEREQDTKQATTRKTLAPPKKNLSEILILSYFILSCQWQSCQ